MTEDSTGVNPATKAAQDALQEVYSQGFAEGRRQGFYLGVTAAKAQMNAAVLDYSQHAFEHPDMPRSTPVDDFEFTVRTYNCLKRAGVHTLGDLLERTAQQLLSLRNFGTVMVEEIQGKIEPYGYTLQGIEKLPKD